MEEIVTKLVAVDGFPVAAISKSEFIRNSFADKGFILPKNPSLVMNMIYKQYDSVKEKLTMEINESLKSGKRFSISLDEFSSLKNQRYLNINIHQDKEKFWSLGMVAIQGHITSEKILEEILLKLEEYRISLKEHVVAMVTDGTSVMVNLGVVTKNTYDCEHQKCIAHAIHLAVCDVLYNKKCNISDIACLNELEATEQPELYLPNDDEIVEENFEPSIEFTIDIDQAETNNEVACISNSLTSNNITIGDSTEKVRNICRAIRKSPLKNGTMQGYIQVHQSPTDCANLILDCKTRWNSLVAMIERFLKLRLPVEKTMIGYKIKIQICEEEEYGCS